MISRCWILIIDKSNLDGKTLVGIFFQPISCWDILSLVYWSQFILTNWLIWINNITTAQILNLKKIKCSISSYLKINHHWSHCLFYVLMILIFKFYLQKILKPIEIYLNNELGKFRWYKECLPLTLHEVNINHMYTYVKYIF